MQAKILEWADELSEAWVGTTLGKIIDAKKNASIQELIEVCEYAQRELNEY